MLNPQNYRNWPYANFTFSYSEELVPILHTVWNLRNVKFAVQQGSYDAALWPQVAQLKTFCILGEWFCRLLIFKLHFSKDVLSALIWVQIVCKKLQSDDTSSQWGIGKLSPSTKYTQQFSFSHKNPDKLCECACYYDQSTLFAYLLW